MKISLNDDIDPTLWNAHVRDRVFHRFEWKDIIQRAYGLEPHFVLAEEASNFALIPAFKVKGRLISVPFTYLAGFAGSSEAFVRRFEEELKGRGEVFEYKSLDTLSAKPDYVSSVVSVKNYDDYLLSLASNMRKQIRKSQRSPFEVQLQNHASDFYSIFSRKMHELGTPVHSKKFFDFIFEKLGEFAIAHTVFLERKVVASMLCLRGVDPVQGDAPTVFIMWACTLRESDALYSNYFLYASALEHYSKKLGIMHFDFGTSLFNSGPFEFKQKWNPTNYSVKLHNSKAGYYKSKKSLVLMGEAWKYLPYRATLLLGPRIRKLLP